MESSLGDALARKNHVVKAAMFALSHKEKIVLMIILIKVVPRIISSFHDMKWTFFL